MSVYYSRHGAALQRFVGFGVAHARPSQARHRLELADIGVFNIYRERMLGERLLASIPIEQLDLQIGTQQITTGGGVVAVTTANDPILFGARAAQARAQRINQRTTRIHEHVTVVAEQQLSNGAQRAVALAFTRIDEATIRDELAQPIHAWAHAYVQAAIAGRLPPARTHSTLDECYASADAMHERGMIDRDQLVLLCSHVSRPFIDAVLSRLGSGAVDVADAQRLMHRVDDMRAHGRLTHRQVKEVRQHVSAILNPPPPAKPTQPPRLDDATRIRLLETLSSLRRTGALTETEYQDEKRRLRDQ